MAACHKRRNSEKRKEKSRDAARHRRGKESEIFSNLANMLPLAPSTIEALDKASVMRLFLSMLKVHSCMEKRSKLEIPIKGSLEEKLDTFYPKALDGFLCMLSKEGDFIYVSESVVKLLGLSQIDLIGQSIYDFAHPCDHEEIEEILSPHADDNEILLPKTLFIRLKCTLMSKGRSVNLKSAMYKVIKLTGKYVPDQASEAIKIENDFRLMTDDDSDDGDDGSDTRERVFQPKPLPHFIAIGEAIPHPSNIEVPLDKWAFISRHSMNMKFTDCDDRIKHLIGYQNDEVIGHSFFGYHHAMDSRMIEKSFKHLFSKGQISTNQYRFLAKNGGYVWMVTEATVIYNNRSQKPESVVCVHYILSYVEQHGRILADVQVSKETIVKDEPKPSAQCQSVSLPRGTRRRDVKLDQMFHVPTFNTEEVFELKTKEMDQEFYFPEGLEKKYDKLNRVNLSHLAPQDSGVCIPLGFPSCTDIQNVENFESHLNLIDGFMKLVKTDLKADVPLPVFTQMDMRDNHHTFASSEESSPDSTMTGSSSPMNYLSTINPSDISAMDTLFATMDPSCDVNNQEIDFLARAPYVPMNPDEDFMFCNAASKCILDTGSDFNPGIYSCTESMFNLKDESYEGPCPEKRPKMGIEMIGGSTVKMNKEQLQDQMMMKLKRPLDRSCLETGPPAKVTKYQDSIFMQHNPSHMHQNLPLVDQSPPLVHQILQHSSPHHSQPVKGPAKSVLLNLLFKGEDIANGYSLKLKTSKPNDNGSNFLQNLLTMVTCYDMDVNAPVQHGQLLHGHDLMRALEISHT